MFLKNVNSVFTAPILRPAHDIKPSVERSIMNYTEWEIEQANWAAREAAAQEYYDSLSEEEFETLLEEGNRLWASYQK